MKPCVSFLNGQVSFDTVLKCSFGLYYINFMEDFMGTRKPDSLKWKNEQIAVFRKYIRNFKPGSVEYIKLAQGIKDLEKVSC